MLAGELETIQEYGLTEYEARAYLALVELEEGTAREVADVSRVPRTKIYGVIDDLHQKSLVEVIPERPKRFLPKAFEGYLDKFEARFKEKLKKLDEDRERFRELIAESDAPAIQGPGQFRVVKGRKNVFNRMMEMVEDAEKSIWMLGSAFAPLRLNYLSPMVHDKVADGLLVRVQCPVLATNRLDVEEAMAYGEVRHRNSENAGSSILLVDGEAALLTHYIPDDTHLFKGEDVSIWTDDPAIVADITELVTRTWADGMPAKDKLAEMPEVSEVEDEKKVSP
ncbi:MAG: helix-turn-helix domain-containing protein [Candidatus Thermoplasmatota archaeon]|nr:helix-turn-helix domain-containing protein [Candidatus Thermoplasmatota archaeon]